MNIKQSEKLMPYGLMSQILHKQNKRNKFILWGSMQEYKSRLQVCTMNLRKWFQYLASPSAKQWSRRMVGVWF